ncbi:hypothetical protein ACE1B6_29235 [Aerosakkonemataceae cyanobacterium BLCC-F154]|uniref:Uncharacterized protein n=1 Tax=Floridaenema fluviatile BLCC-F154 TaxID=3153640 RepID=A0ABV4YKJ8_9CYAN
MNSKIYRICLASSFSLCCLFTPKTATAQAIFLYPDNFVDDYQLIALNTVISVTQNREINCTNKATNTGTTTNNPAHNVAITNSKNLELQSSQSKVKTGLEAKSGKKPPRKG